MTRGVLWMLAALVLGCAPQLRGECDGDDACPLDTRCVEGLCLSSVDDERRCPVTCPDGEHCNEALQCVPTPTATIEIVSPSAALFRASSSVPVLVRATAAGGVNEVVVTLDDLVSASLKPQPQEGADMLSGVLDVPALAHGAHTLRATARWSGGEVLTETQLWLDANGPTITPEPIEYPRTRAGLSSGAFSLSDSMQVHAFIDDAPAGLDGPPVLVDGARRTPGDAVGQGRWRFTLPVQTPATGEATLNLTIDAKDTVGNTSSASVQARVSRHAWRWRPSEVIPITAAPALVGDLLVFGDEAGVVTALRQADGELVWQVELDAAVVGHISGSTSPDDLTVHAVTRSGSAWWIDASGTAGEDRVLARCPEVGVPGREPAAGASVAGDTLFVVTLDGYLQLLRPRAFTDGGSCVQEHRLQQGAGVSAPSLSPRAGGVDAYLATRDGRLHRVDVTLPVDAAPTFVDAWSKTAAPQAEVRGAPALGPVDARTSLVVGTGDSRAFGHDADGQALPLGGKLLSGAIVAGPALVGGDAYFIDQAGAAQRLRLSDGRKLWAPDFRGLARSPNALAGPVVGRSGNTCLLTGVRLSCVTPGGVVRWSHDDRAGRALDLVTPALGCDGRLFVASQAGTIEAFDTDTGGPAKGWSRPGGDGRNTSNVAASDACDW